MPTVAAPATLALYALAASGKRASLEIPLTDSSPEAFSATLRTALQQQGFSEQEAANARLSPLAFAPAAKSAASYLAPSPRLLTVEDVAAQSDLPPIPQPTGPDDLPPSRSESVIVAASSDLSVYIQLDNEQFIPTHPLPMAPFARLTPRFPKSSHVAYKRYWLNAGSYIIVGPQTFSQAITTTTGMSQTDSETLSAELGVADEGLSAKLSASVSQSITISASQTTTQTYTLPETPAGSTCVYTLWQLVEEFVLVDENNVPIQWGGYYVFGNLGNISATLPQALFANNTTVYASSPVTFPSAS